MTPIKWIIMRTNKAKHNNILNFKEAFKCHLYDCAWDCIMADIAAMQMRDHLDIERRDDTFTRSASLWPFLPLNSQPFRIHKQQFFQRFMVDANVDYIHALIFNCRRIAQMCSYRRLKDQWQFNRLISI